MRISLRAVLALAALVAVLALSLDRVLDRAIRNWFEHDAARMARLAVTSANTALAERWRGATADALLPFLVDIGRDERVLAVAACGYNSRPVAATERFPMTLDCDEARGLASAATSRAGDIQALLSRLPRIDGYLVSSVPVVNGGATLGFVAVVHDLRSADLRTTQAKSVVFGVLAVFGVAYILFSLLYGRVARRTWTRQVRSVLGGLSGATDLRRLLADLRAMRAKLEAERAAAQEERLWTPGRLRELVRDTLEGTDVIVLANREPLIHERDASGAVTVMRPAGGLVTALDPVVRACAGTWVAHGSGSADRDVVDRHDRIIVPPSDAPFTLRRVWLEEQEERGYYYGFANEGLWPLCHIAPAQPQFRSSDFAQYRAVNERFADAVAEECGRDDAVILVQDYHFALAPAMLRARLPRATIVMFWHIPWPQAERFGICPWRTEILEGMLGASIVGFHTQQHCNNFMESVDVLLEARIDRERSAVVRHGRTSLVRPYPIAVEWPPQWSDTEPSPAQARELVARRYGIPTERLLGVGVDRLDYTKGIEERFLAVDKLLERHPEFRGRFTFIQIAAPSRTEVHRYREFAQDVVSLARTINARWGTREWEPIVLRHEHHDIESIVAHYRAANLCYVSSLHDGMNLVAKEFVAARADEQGVLLLSRFTGSARELTEALVVNPYDIDQAADAMARALCMSGEEQQERMRAMRAHVREWNVYRWAGRILADAAREREQTLRSSRLGRSLPWVLPNDEDTARRGRPLVAGANGLRSPAARR